MAIVSMGFFVAASFYHPYAAYHRWVGAGIIYYAFTHVNMFLYYLDDDNHPAVGYLLLVVQYIVGIVMAVIFMVLTIKAPAVYQFTGHFWDLQSDAISRIVSLVMFSYMMVFFGIAAWKIRIFRGERRYRVIAITLAYIIAVLAPALAYGLTRLGLIDRALYHIVYNMFTVLGFFILTLLYINFTDDRTTFMTRIVGITLVTFLVFMQGISFLFLKDKDEGYNKIHLAYSRLAVDEAFKADDLDYFISYSVRKDGPTGMFVRDGKKFFMSGEHVSELMNSEIWQRIAALPESAGCADVERTVAGSHLYFDGYARSVKAFCSAGETDAPGMAGRVLAEIKSGERLVSYHRKRISDLPDESFRRSLADYLSGSSSSFKPFGDAIRARLGTAGNDGSELKADVMRFLAPMLPPEKRRYRSMNGDHYISFLQVDGKSGTVHESGFSYLKYREYIHPSSLELIMVLGMMSIFITAFFRIFFLGTLIRPLNELINGVEEISRSNYDVKIHVKAEDEIGFLTHNFNRMARTIKMALTKIDEYTFNLEEMVSERTAELERTKDALWGEMALAKKIQTVLLPRAPSMPGYELSVYIDPAEEIGGDYYDIISMGEKQWVVIGDVSGHGVSAGLITMMLQTSLLTGLIHDPRLNPSNLLKTANRVMERNIKRIGEDRYITIVVLSVSSDGEIEFSGRHEDIMVYRKATGRVELVPTRGMWLGIKEDISGMLTDGILQLEPGDSLMLYTDGITEAMADRGKVFTKKRLAEIFEEEGKKSTEEIKSRIIEELKNFRRHDDVTFLILKKT